MCHSGVPIPVRLHTQRLLPRGFLALQIAPWELLPPARLGWTCTLGLDISLGARQPWRLVQVISFLQGAGCQSRFSALAKAADVCSGACGGVLQVPTGDASLQGYFTAETPLPPQ